jgi:phage tail-like protein
MARVTATDPIRNFKFQVNIIPTGTLAANTKGIGTLGFAVMSGLSVQNEMIGYREGGMNTHPHKLIGQSDFAPVTFSRGVFHDQAHMYRWQEFIHSWNQADNGSTTGNNDYRCDIVVKVYDHPVSAGTYQTPSNVDGVNPELGGVRLAIKLYDCWPGAYAISDLNAADSGIMVQQLTVHHEGFHIAWSPAEIAEVEAKQ